jgi:hypothetical protein
VLAAFEPLRAGLVDRLGARFTVDSRPDWPLDRLEVAGA